MTRNTRTTTASVRARPWVWGMLIVGLLTGLGLVGDPIGPRAVTVDPFGQLGRIALFALPATLTVGALYAFIPGRHVVLRTALLLVLAVIVAGFAARFIYRATGDICGPGGPQVCATTVLSRVIGGGGMAVAWILGLGAEEAVRAFRRSRRRS